MPCRLGTSGSVRASTIAKSEKCAHVLHTFCPLSSQTSPSRSARHPSDARSEPAPGSLNSWHHFSSLLTIGGRNRSRCSSDPYANSAAAVLFKPSGLSRPRLNGRSSASIARASSGVASRPPYARGHVGTTKPDAANTGYHCSYSARVRTSRTAAAPPRRPASTHARGTFASTHVFTSSAFRVSSLTSVGTPRRRRRAHSGGRWRRRAARADARGRARGSAAESSRARGW